MSGAKPKTEMEPLWNVSDVAAFLKVAKRTVTDLCQRNKIEHIRIGNGRGVIRFRPQDVRKFVEQRLLDSQASVDRSHPGSSLFFD